MSIPRSRHAVLTAIPILTVGIFVLDLFTPRGVADWAWYFIPLLLSVYVRRRYLSLFLAACFSALTILGFLLSPARDLDANAVVASHGVGICVMWLIAVLLSQLQRADERLRQHAELLDLAHDAILVCDLEDRIFYWNKSAERIFGWTAQEALGKKAWELLPKTDFKFEEAEKSILEKGDWSGDLVCRTKNGREVNIETRWTLVRNDRGIPGSILSITTDVTEKKKLQEQLFRSQRMESVGTLAGGIAHDLNNILAPLMMSVAVLKQNVSDAESRTILASLEVNVKRAADLVKQVLTFGRGASGERVLVNPIEIAREVECIIRETFPKFVQFEFHCLPDIWNITGDPTQLHQVLLNLCVNARDAMPNGGTLSITMENTVLDETYASMNLEAKPGPYVVIKVSDTGEGIPPKLTDRIFEPFFTTKETGKGTGLGLSSALAIVRSHGGLINLYTEMGKGSTFKIYLPAKPAPDTAENVAVEQTGLPRGQNELILLVDDEEPIRAVARKVLERFGYRVLLAANGAEAVSLYAQPQNKVDVVITDMAMPIMDGLSTILALKSINPKVKIIASSGLAANGGVAKAMGAGVHHFIPKPYTAEAMLHKLHAVIQETL